MDNLGVNNIGSMDGQPGFKSYYFRDVTFELSFPIGKLPRVWGSNGILESLIHSTRTYKTLLSTKHFCVTLAIGDTALYFALMEPIVADPGEHWAYSAWHTVNTP